MYTLTVSQRTDGFGGCKNLTSSKNIISSVVHSWGREKIFDFFKWIHFDIITVHLNSVMIIR